ncbi:hypothetical protein TNCV_2671611 [Trichonephila clavipes]|nr:hypothetical protein TNCV_2671611 [Trichonephila clavipes]
MKQGFSHKAATENTFTCPYQEKPLFVKYATRLSQRNDPDVAFKSPDLASDLRDPLLIAVECAVDKYSFNEVPSTYSVITDSRYLSWNVLHGIIAINNFESDMANGKSSGRKLY